MASTNAGGWRDLSKRNAFLIHLALSLLFFATLVIAMLTFWFPGKLFFLDGGWQGLKLVALVDVVLGPALTLLLYKPRKPKLVFDMAIIAFIQIAALGYGFVTTYQQRTVAMVYSENNFNSLSNVAYTKAAANLEKLNESPQAIAALDKRIPAVLISPLPSGGSAKYLEQLLNGYPQLHERSDNFIPAINNSDKLRDQTVSSEILKSEDPGGLVEKALAKIKNKESIGVYRFKARYASGFALYDHDNASIVDYIKINKDGGDSTTVAESSN